MGKPPPPPPVLPVPCAHLSLGVTVFGGFQCWRLSPALAGALPCSSLHPQPLAKGRGQRGWGRKGQDRTRRKKCRREGEEENAKKTSQARPDVGPWEQAEWGGEGQPRGGQDQNWPTELCTSVPVLATNSAAPMGTLQSHGPRSRVSCEPGHGGQLRLLHVLPQGPSGPECSILQVCPLSSQMFPQQKAPGPPTWLTAPSRAPALSFQSRPGLPGPGLKA